MSEIENKISPYLRVSQDVIGRKIETKKINLILEKILKKINGSQSFDQEFLDILNNF